MNILPGFNKSMALNEPAMQATRTLLVVVLTALLISGCAAPTKLVRDDMYSRNVLFTVPLVNEYGMQPTAFSSMDEEQSDTQIIIQGVLKFHRLRKVTQFSISALGVEAVVAEIEPKRNLSDVISALREDRRIQSVQSISPYKLLSYNDPYFALQNTVNGDRIEHIHEITTGKNVTVGIIDTGVDRWHPELVNSIIYTNNLVADDQSSFDLDEHGTAVAGVIGSAANNDLGIVGVAPDVKLMVFKACHQELASRRTTCDSVSIIKALNDVLQQQPDILNLSLSGPTDPIIEKLLHAASKKGMVLVAAIDESRGKEKSFPANMNEVIAVGTSVSNFRTGFLEYEEDVVLAPGTDMLTTAPGATYGFKSGSSMATAYVSGIAALMKEKVPTLTSTQIYNYLKDSARLDENELPVVDMCTAVNYAANTAYESCERVRSMAIRVDGPDKATSNSPLTN
jgi:subtilisin family serine protease